MEAIKNSGSTVVHMPLKDTPRQREIVEEFVEGNAMLFHLLFL